MYIYIYIYMYTYTYIYIYIYTSLSLSTYKQHKYMYIGPDMCMATFRVEQPVREENFQTMLESFFRNREVRSLLPIVLQTT